MTDDFWIVLAFNLLAAAAVLIALFYVIRAAILSALERDRVRVETASRKPAPLTHLDQDGV